MTRTFALRLLLVVTGLLRVGTATATPSAAPLPLALVADLPLPGGPSRFDYQWVDEDNRRLYIAHLGDSSLLAFDLDAQQIIHELRGLPSAHGVAGDPAQHLLFATATAEKTLAIIDARTFEMKARVPAGAYPNGLGPANG